MICLDHFWKGILLSCFLCILLPSRSVTDARRYDKCTTHDDRPGVCVAKRYCREAATSQPLLTCEGDDENHCCPIPTTLRSAPPPPPPPPHQNPPRDRDSRFEEKPRYNERPRVRDEPRYEERPRVEDSRGGSRGREEPRYNGRPRVEDDERDSTRHGVPRGRDEPRYNERPRTEDVGRDSRTPESPRGVRDKPRYDERPGAEDDGRDSRVHEPPRGREKPQHNEDSRVGDDERYSRTPESPRDRKEHRNVDRPRAENDERYSRVPELPRGWDEPRHDDRPRMESDERDRRKPTVSRGREDPRYDERPRAEEDERDKRRPVYPKDVLDERDDRLNKTPPPADRRSPTRTQRPKEYDRPRDEVYDKEKRVPPKSHHNPPPADHRPREDDIRRPSDQQNARHPEEDRYYPNRGRPDPDPPRRRNHTHDSSAKAPIRFPDYHDEQPAPRPKVPGCGVKPYDLFIAGGTESAEHEWPWMTAIFRRHPDSRPKTFLCGGSLVNRKYVLTAAHCFVNNYVVLPASAFVVRLGSHFLDSGEEYTVSDLVIHHNHSGSDFFNDIALVRLASEVAVTDKIAPVCLPDPAMLRQDLVGQMATVAGWGDTAFRTSGARILQHVSVPIVSGEECFAAYSRVRGAAFLARGSDHVICAGLREGGKDACLGDSGGPLMLKLPDDRWVVVGIVSLGYKCAEPGYPGVYTRVTHYTAWIAANMKRH